MVRRYDKSTKQTKVTSEQFLKFSQERRRTFGKDRWQAVVNVLLGHLVCSAVHWSVCHQLTHELLNLAQKLLPCRTILSHVSTSRKYLCTPWAPAGGARGCTCTPPLEFENDDVIWCLHAKCTKFSLAPPALVIPTLKLSIKP